MTFRLSADTYVLHAIVSKETWPSHARIVLDVYAGMQHVETGFRLYWGWKSRHHHGRPAVSLEVQNLILQMSRANPRWGAPRIHGEVLRIGIEVCHASVAKYMARHRQPPSQAWRTFLKNHSNIRRARAPGNPFVKYIGAPPAFSSVHEANAWVRTLRDEES